MPIPGYTSQLPLPDSCPVADAIEQFAVAGIEERGAIFTRREVVEFILDLSGYTADQPLYNHRLLEPSFGEGDFLLIAIERLLDSWQRSDSRSALVEALAGCLRGVELHRSSFERTRAKAATLLRGEGLSEEEAAWLVDTWLVQGDFLLADLPGAFDHVVGNPPYVRQELIPDPLIVEYRARYSTIFDRADIYIPFIERSLTLLNEGGTLGYICADRWMKNRYGGPLRKLVAHQYHLKVYVDMVDTDAFHTEVIAYPAITIITREKPGRTRIAHRPPIEKQALVELAHQLLAHDQPAPGGPVKEMAGVAAGAEPWLLQSPDQLMVIRRLERDFPLLENTGCKVGIGVATGADKAFIGPYEGLDVEPDRKLPLVMTRDLLNGEVQWRGLGVVNPFADDGGLVELDRYPRLKRYLEERRSQISKRHIAQKAPASWFRTIDRIYPAITKEPKLLVPDIKGEAHIVYEAGQLYPHHNLYYITSSEWDLKALRAVLLSGIAKLFVSVYSTRMRGGYLRFQAQYLRRIRLPHWDSVPATLKKRLINAAERGDVGACNKAVFRLYGLSEEERAAIGGNGD